MARRNSILVSRTLYQLGAVTLFAALLWVAMGIYQATGMQFKLEIDPSILEPINPTIDQEVIKIMTERLQVEEALIIEVPLATESATPSSLPDDSIEAGATP